MTKPRTKNQRLLDIFSAYRDKVNRAVTMDEVSEWTIASGLYPVPGRSATQAERDDWDRRFLEVTR